MNVSFPFLVVNETRGANILHLLLLTPFSLTLTEAAFVLALFFFSIQFS